MKKFLVGLLLVGMVFSSVACTGKSVSEGGDKLVMVTNAEFPPYEYIDNGEYVGIDVECAAAIAKKLGLKLEVMDVAFDSIIPSVMSGKGDFAMAGMTVTEDRKENVDFTQTYQTAIQNIIVTEDSDIKSIDDLYNDKLIGVMTGFTGDIYATDDFGEGHVVRFKNGIDAVQALITGKVDCVMNDDQVAKKYVQANKGLKLLDTPYAEEEYAACVKKGNTELLNKIDNAISELKSSGEFEAIVNKYIKD